mgnify:CR=1 FL=1
MKKLVHIIPVIAGVIMLLLLCTQCHKDPVYNARITCRFSTNGIDTGQVASFTHLEIGKADYGDFAKRSVNTDVRGIYETTFQYEALLDIVGTLTTYDEDSVAYHFLGTGQIKLIPDELAEAVILMIPQ